MTKCWRGLAFEQRCFQGSVLLQPPENQGCLVALGGAVCNLFEVFCYMGLCSHIYRVYKYGQTRKVHANVLTVL